MQKIRMRRPCATITTFSTGLSEKKRVVFASIFPVHVAVERTPKITNPIVDVGSRLSVRKAEVEASEFLALSKDLFHLMGILEISEVLLPQPRLARQLDFLALECRQHS
jgi:hypothetical protein